MQFIHIVILKFKPDITEGQVNEIFAALKNLLDSKLIPGLLEYSGGPYDSPEGMNKGFTHAFIMKFADRETRDAYFPHPDHEVVKNMIIPNVDDAIAFDYAV